MLKFLKRFLLGAEVKISEYAQKQEKIGGEHCLYITNDKHASRKRDGYTEWMTYEPSWRKFCRKTKVKIDISQFECRSTVIGGHYIVRIPSQIHTRLVNQSSVMESKKYKERKILKNAQ